MEKTKICGSTQDCAELIVDYKKGTNEIKGVPEDSIPNRITAAFKDWVLYMSILSAILWLIFTKVTVISAFKLTGSITGSIFVIILLLHLNKSFDKKVKKYFAKRTGNGQKNRIRFTNIKSKELVIYNTRNRVVEFEAEGDVNKQLNKIWIKEEHPSSILTSQANIEDMRLLGNDDIWNVHFIFEEVPKDGSLFVEWI